MIGSFRDVKASCRHEVVVRGEMPAHIRRSAELWMGCVAGALEESEYREKLLRAGFSDVEIEATRVYRVHEGGEIVTVHEDQARTDADAGRFISAFVRASKPQ